MGSAAKAAVSGSSWPFWKRWLRSTAILGLLTCLVSTTLLPGGIVSWVVMCAGGGALSASLRSEWKLQPRGQRTIAVLGFVIVIVVALVLLGTVWYEADLRTNGVAARATIVRVNYAKGRTIGDFEVTFRPPGEAPITASLDPAGVDGRLREGDGIDIRYDSEDPSEIVAAHVDGGATRKTALFVVILAFLSAMLSYAGGVRIRTSTRTHDNNPVVPPVEPEPRSETNEQKVARIRSELADIRRVPPST